MPHSRLLYEILNILLFAFHTLIILLNTLGWIFRRTRRLSLVMLGLTTLSWFGMGAWYGWGYCLCTDWHWQVRQALGIQDHVSTYVQLLLLEITGVHFPAGPVEDFTFAVYLASMIGCLWTNFRDFKAQRRQPVPAPE